MRDIIHAKLKRALEYSTIIGFGGLCIGFFLFLYGYSTNLHDIAQGTHENFVIHGHFHGVLYDKDWNIKQIIDKDNLIVTNGFKGLAKLTWNANSGVSPSTYTYIALGSGSSGPSSSDTALGTECGYSRQNTASPTYSSAVITLTGTFTGSTCTNTEAGVFDASSSGNMISRVVYSAITAGTSDSLVVTYTFTLS